jgi:hypothetical protein
MAVALLLLPDPTMSPRSVFWPLVYRKAEEPDWPTTWPESLIPNAVPWMLTTWPTLLVNLRGDISPSSLGYIKARPKLSPTTCPRLLMA